MEDQPCLTLPLAFIRAKCADLEGLWGVAACAALPTLAEGFGLPVVEAMARGVPVACSDIPVLHEVGGSAVRYFDPHDPDDAAQAIRSALGNAELAERGGMRSGLQDVAGK